MKKTFTVNGHEVEFTSCSAIAATIGETERRSAVYVHDISDEFSDGDGVLFGVEVPESDEEAADLLDESIPLDTNWETLNTVEY